LPLPNVLQKIIGFLRAGYPDGVPEVDYIPLFALLARRLSSEEVIQIANELAALGQIDGALDHESIVRQAVSEVTHQPALEADVERVEARLEAVGWVPDSLTTED
jgi:hypothetical protein